VSPDVVAKLVSDGAAVLPSISSTIQAALMATFWPTVLATLMQTFHTSQLSPVYATLINSNQFANGPTIR
jgi:hypothetical protein